VLPVATVLDFLDQHAGAFAALLTLVLIAVTAYYAFQNRRMVKEMERTRELSLLPRLALEFHRLASATVTLAIRNVGPGAALDIDVRMVYEPAESSRGTVEHRWRRNLLVSGAQYDFIPPDGLNSNIDGLPATFRDIRLVGSMADATGKRHEVDEVFPDLPEWREVLEGAHQRYVADDPERRLAEALGKRLQGPIASVAREVQMLTRGVYRLVPSQPESDHAGTP
jgi:hypothetical protein